VKIHTKVHFFFNGADERKAKRKKQNKNTKQKMMENGYECKNTESL